MVLPDHYTPLSTRTHDGTAGALRHQRAAARLGRRRGAWPTASRMRRPPGCSSRAGRGLMRLFLAGHGAECRIAAPAREGRRRSGLDGSEAMTAAPEQPERTDLTGEPARRRAPRREASDAGRRPDAGAPVEPVVTTTAERYVMSGGQAAHLVVKEDDLFLLHRRAGAGGRRGELGAGPVLPGHALPQPAGAHGGRPQAGAAVVHRRARLRRHHRADQPGVAHARTGASCRRRACTCGARASSPTVCASRCACATSTAARSSWCWTCTSTPTSPTCSRCAGCAAAGAARGCR